MLLRRHSPQLAFPMPILLVLQVLFLGVLSVPGCSVTKDQDLPMQEVTFLPVGVAIRAEVADTELTRQKGLMYRTSIGEKEGMIFYFDQPGHHAFYMYNTRIPLSAIFVDEGLRIVDIQDMAPCVDENPAKCPIYPPRAACKYVIEVNQEFVRKYEIKVGDYVQIQK